MMGQPTPFGATVQENGTNFAIFSRHASHVWLHLFAEPTDDTPSHTFELDPAYHRTGDIWHIFLPDVQHGQLYLYQMDGPYYPLYGHRFNRHKPLFDPYAKAIINGSNWDFGQSLGYDTFSPEEDLSFSTVTNFGISPKCMVYGDDGFDWGRDRPLSRPLNETVIYETHVRSLTQHSTAKVKYPGSYGGVAEMASYFRRLGVTAVELLPMFQFNEWEFTRYNDNGERMGNYWGYNTMAFFAPHETYSHRTERGGAILAFKEMVKALHTAGIEVILDVVFNHTVEGNEKGPTLSFRGIDNNIYYILTEDRRYYYNHSGTGNTFNANHPVVQDFIMDCLRYWVREMHVDGFRFDLATCLCRDETGKLAVEPPLVRRIAEDPLLRGTKIIAEPWDINGYQVGHFPGGRWVEWNDKYRDHVRQFWRGDPGLTSNLATRLAGSSDLFSHSMRPPNYSLNFIAAHDGFTLNDMVSYNEKHNEANGENNNDGHNNNLSNNYGHEGPSHNPFIEATRQRQSKNLMATLLLSLGTPMLNGGDEFRRTQNGNNNAYCQNSELSWYNWTLLHDQAEMFRFTQRAIAIRQAHPIFRRWRYFSDSDIWYTPIGTPADWKSYPKELICVMDGHRDNTGAGQDDNEFILMFNANSSSQLFYLPPPRHPDHDWHLVLDTGIPAPNDIHPVGQEVELDEPLFYPLYPRSLAVLLAKRPGDSQWLMRTTPYKHRVPKPRKPIRRHQIINRWQRKLEE